MDGSNNSVGTQSVPTISFDSCSSSTCTDKSTTLFRKSREIAENSCGSVISGSTESDCTPSPLLLDGLQFLTRKFGTCSSSGDHHTENDGDNLDTCSTSCSESLLESAKGIQDCSLLQVESKSFFDGSPVFSWSHVQKLSWKSHLSEAAILVEDDEIVSNQEPLSCPLIPPSLRATDGVSVVVAEAKLPGSENVDESTQGRRVDVYEDSDHPLCPALDSEFHLCQYPRQPYALQQLVPGSYMAVSNSKVNDLILDRHLGSNEMICTEVSSQKESLDGGDQLVPSTRQMIKNTTSENRPHVMDSDDETQIDGSTSMFSDSSLTKSSVDNALKLVENQTLTSSKETSHQRDHDIGEMSGSRSSSGGSPASGIAFGATEACKTNSMAEVPYLHECQKGHSLTSSVQCIKCWEGEEIDQITLTSDGGLSQNCFMSSEGPYMVDHCKQDVDILKHTDKDHQETNGIVSSIDGGDRGGRRTAKIVTGRKRKKCIRIREDAKVKQDCCSKATKCRKKVNDGKETGRLAVSSTEQSSKVVSARSTRQSAGISRADKLIHSNITSLANRLKRLSWSQTKIEKDLRQPEISCKDGTRIGKQMCSAHNTLRQIAGEINLIKEDLLQTLESIRLIHSQQTHTKFLHTEMSKLEELQQSLYKQLKIHRGLACTLQAVLQKLKSRPREEGKNQGEKQELGGGEQKRAYSSQTHQNSKVMCPVQSVLQTSNTDDNMRWQNSLLQDLMATLDESAGALLVRLMSLLQEKEQSSNTEDKNRSGSDPTNDTPRHGDISPVGKAYENQGSLPASTCSALDKEGHCEVTQRADEVRDSMNEGREVCCPSPMADRCSPSEDEAEIKQRGVMFHDADIPTRKSPDCLKAPAIHSLETHQHRSVSKPGISSNGVTRNMTEEKDSTAASGTEHPAASKTQLGNIFSKAPSAPTAEGISSSATGTKKCYTEASANAPTATSWPIYQSTASLQGQFHRNSQHGDHTLAVHSKLPDIRSLKKIYLIDENELLPYTQVLPREFWTSEDIKDLGSPEDLVEDINAW